LLLLLLCLYQVFEESYRQIDELIGFTAAVEEQLADCLKNGTIPSEKLVSFFQEYLSGG
jgi:hypothetical protein